ncbi:5'(3')-deoxyribonucleotidase, mitochondrial isoform X3 [Balaenoptera musculus]|uniref:5'(3')-deoxyribonucleotidase, mitochondrial isoform X3 n=1 Tax=Balaenoptera musculus TaxID=9771 RepID=A0A8C0DWV3_BALMU|nr:5'(3')-deoxyribonucleotidase, mitochondrial isoform X3 [Balaenoptera musculus]
MIRLRGWCARRPRGAAVPAGPAGLRWASGGPAGRALRVLVDMDGVLADFEGGFLRKFRARFPDQPFIALEDRRGFWVSEQYDRLQPGLSEKAISIWESENFFFDLEPLPGAVEAVKQMANLESTDVFICTSPIKMYKYCPFEKVELHKTETSLEIGNCRVAKPRGMVCSPGVGSHQRWAQGCSCPEEAEELPRSGKVGLGAQSPCSGADLGRGAACPLGTSPRPAPREKQTHTVSQRSAPPARHTEGMRPRRGVAGAPLCASSSGHPSTRQDPSAQHSPLSSRWLRPAVSVPGVPTSLSHVRPSLRGWKHHPSYPSVPQQACFLLRLFLKHTSVSVAIWGEMLT